MFKLPQTVSRQAGIEERDRIYNVRAGEMRALAGAPRGN